MVGIRSFPIGDAYFQVLWLLVSGRVFLAEKEPFSVFRSTCEVDLGWGQLDEIPKRPRVKQLAFLEFFFGNSGSQNLPKKMEWNVILVVTKES